MQLINLLFIIYYKFIIDFCFCKKVFTHMNIWMISKNSMKYFYLRKRIFTVTIWNKRFRRAPWFACSFSNCIRISKVRSLKKDKVNLHLFTDIDIPLMVERGSRCGICHAICESWLQIQGKSMIKIKNRPILNIGT